MGFKCFSVAMTLILFCLPTVHAEKIDMTPAQLRKTATHVIVGKVHAVYLRAETTRDWQYRRYVAEIEIKECEKGKGPVAGGIAYVRYWERRWRGKEPVTSTAGHRGLPSAGQTLRVYLARNAYDGFTLENKDGGFNVIGANGFEIIKKSSKRKK